MTISFVNPCYTVSRTSPPSHVKALFEEPTFHKATEVSSLAHSALHKKAIDAYTPLDLKPKSTIRDILYSRSKPADEATPALQIKEEKRADASARSAWLRSFRAKSKSALESGASASTRMLCSEDSRSSAASVASSLYEAGEITIEVLKALGMALFE